MKDALNWLMTNWLDIATLITAVVAIIISIIVHRQTHKMNQYEFISAENTKKELMNLSAALHLIVDKAMLAHLIKGIDIQEEKKIINDFLLSDTWVAMKYVVNKNTEEGTIILTPKLLLLLYDDNIKSVGDMAYTVEQDITQICNDYLSEIVKIKEDISNNLENFMKENSLTHDIYQKRENTHHQQNKDAKERLSYLKDYGISDPNIDLWLGMLNDSVQDVEAAVNNGADVNCPLGMILDKYKDIQ